MDQSLLQNLPENYLIKEEPIDEYDTNQFNVEVTGLSSVVKIEENEIPLIQNQKSVPDLISAVKTEENEITYFQKPVTTDLTSVVKVEENEIPSFQNPDQNKRNGDVDLNKLLEQSSNTEGSYDLFNFSGNRNVCDLSSVIKVEDVEISPMHEKQIGDLTSIIKVEDVEISPSHRKQPHRRKKPKTVKETTYDVFDEIGNSPEAEAHRRKKPKTVKETTYDVFDEIGNSPEAEDGNIEEESQPETIENSNFVESLIEEQSKNFNPFCYNCKEELPTFNIWLEHTVAFKNFKGCFPESQKIEPIVEEKVSDKSSNSYSVITKIFKCTHCDFKTFYKPMFIVHYETLHGPKFSCAFCPKFFRNTNFLKKHISYVHSSARVLYKCKHCDYSSKDKECLASHMLVHTNTYFYCKICGFRAKTQKRIDTHNTRRHTKQAKQYMCAMCPYKTSDRETLQKHLLCVHGKEYKNFPCSLCPFKTTSSEQLSSHVKKCHKEKRIFFTCYCGFKTHINRALMAHRINEHSSQPDFECKECPFKTLKIELFFVHCNVKHKNRLPLECLECPHIGQNVEELRLHIMREHKPFVSWVYCAYCDYKCFYKSGLISHIAFKHMENSRKYKCKQCKYSAKTKLLLKQHTNIRHNPDAIIYHCSHCSHKNKVKFKLVQHIKEKHMFVKKKKKKSKRSHL